MCARTGKFSLIFASALLLSSALPALAEIQNFHQAPQSASQPAVTTGSCTTGAEAYSVATTPQSTFSKTFSIVTGTTVSFTEGTAGCVEVSFSAETITARDEVMLTQAVLDGSTLCIPGDNLFSTSAPAGYPATHAMNYICPSVSAGNHSITMQFASYYGSKVWLDYRTTVVRYAP